MHILWIKDLPDQMGRKYKRPHGSDGGVFRGRGVQVPSTLSTTCFLMLLLMIMMTDDVDLDMVEVEFWSLTVIHPPVREWAVLKEFAERKERVFYLEPQTCETIHEINWNSFENFFVHLGSCCVKMWKRRKLLWDSPSEHLDHRSLSRKRQTCFWWCHQWCQCPGS